MLLVASAALTASAQDFASKKGGELVDAKREALTQRATVNRGAEAKTDFLAPMVRTSKTFGKNVFSSANVSSLRRLAPMAAAAEAANVPEMQGNLIYSDDQEMSTGIYNIPTAAGQSFELQLATVGANMGGIAVDGKYYVHNLQNILGMFQIFAVCVYDMETGEELAQYEVTLGELAPGGLAVNPVDGDVYGIFYTADGAGFRLGSVDYTENGPVVTEIAVLQGDWAAFAIDKSGQFYGIKREISNQTVVSSALYKLDKTNGAATLVGETGMLPQYITGMAFELNSNRLFWTVCPADETGFLTEINVATGVATKVYDFPNNEEITALSIPLAPNAGAPSAATDLKVDFVKESLSGTVSFKAPTTTYDGAEATGDVNYEVLFNDEVVLSGTTTFGAAVSAPVTVDESGTYKVVVKVSNEEGEGPVTKTSLFIGWGVPETPIVHLAYVDGNMKISWTPVSQTIGGGYIDPENVTYDVVRYPGEVHLGTLGHLVNSTSEVIAKTPEIVEYYYTVTVNNGGNVSAAGKSNVVALGDYMVPAKDFTFDTPGDLSLFTILDANADGKTWTWFNGEMRVTYNSSMDMDDWLFLPAFKLDAKKLYQFTIDARANGASYPETVEVKMGTAAKPEAMTTTLIEPTVVQSKDPENLLANIVPDKDGVYYIGVHGISKADMFYLYIDNISISNAMSAAKPEAVSDLVVVPGPNGALYGNVTFKNPAKMLDGTALTTLDSVKVFDGEGAELYKAGPVAAGAEMVVPVTVPTDGTYAFTVVTYVKDVEGLSAAASEYIGIDFPEAPAEVNMVETATLGEVKLTWSAVTKDVRGSDLKNPTYSVYTIEDGYLKDQLASGLTTTSYTYQAVPAGEQELVFLAVMAESVRGESKAVAGPMMYIGTPWAGYLESFGEGELSHPLMVRTIAGNPSWSLFNDESGIPSQDGDNGFIGMKASYLDEAGSMVLGKISLAGMAKPGLSFYTYNLDLEGGDDVNIIQVYVDDLSVAGEPELVYENDVNSTGAKDRWNRIYVDLAEYKDKVINIEIAATVQAAAYTMFDNIFVGQMAENDLAIAIDAPATVAPEQEFNVVATVANEGTKAAGKYTVKLIANDVVIATEEGEGLAFDSDKTFEFPYTFTPLNEDPIEFVAEVIYKDEVAENNVSNKISVAPKVSKYPAPTNLIGEVTPEGVALTWDEPKLVDVPEVVTEDFEGGEDYAKEFEGWTFIDVDQSAVGGFQVTDIPGVTAGETLASFIVFDQSIGNQTFAAHSGTKYLAALFRYDDGQTDDWAISPMLSGNAQTVSFYAKSYSDQYPEKIEVYYSTGSLAVKDFVKVNDVVTVPNDWTLYTAELPAGAKYFAIRSCATGSFMLMIDDATYETNGDVSSLEILGYNVYRNGQKVNDEPVADLDYVDVPEASMNLEYAVTTVYNKGESKASNRVLITASGLDQVVAGVEIVAEEGRIIVTGAEGLAVSVVAVDGKVVFAAEGSAKTVINASAGVYVVKAGKKVAKVLVK